MTVYVVNETRDDITPAKVYGDVFFISFFYVYGDEIDGERMPANIEARLDKFARRFNPKTDYLLIVGDHLQLISFAAKLGALHGSFRVLRFDRMAKGYYPVEICAKSPVPACR